MPDMATTVTAVEHSSSSSEHSCTTSIGAARKQRRREARNTHQHKLAAAYDRILFLEQALDIALARVSPPTSQGALTGAASNFPTCEDACSSAGSSQSTMASTPLLFDIYDHSTEADVQTDPCFTEDFADSSEQGTSKVIAGFVPSEARLTALGKLGTLHYSFRCQATLFSLWKLSLTARNTCCSSQRPWKRRFRPKCSTYQECSGSGACGKAVTADIVCWRSANIPRTIRRPWQVYVDELYFSLENAGLGGPLEEIKQQLALVEYLGDYGAFHRHLTSAPPAEIKQQLRFCYDVSLAELAAFICWRDARRAALNGGLITADIETVWNSLDPEEQAMWVPEHPSVFVAQDPQWAPLLYDWDPDG